MMSPADHYAKACGLVQGLYELSRLVNEDPPILAGHVAQVKATQEHTVAMAQLHATLAAVPWGLYEMARAEQHMPRNGDDV